VCVSVRQRDCRIVSSYSKRRETRRDLLADGGECGVAESQCGLAPAIHGPQVVQLLFSTGTHRPLSIRVFPSHARTVAPASYSVQLTLHLHTHESMASTRRLPRPALTNTDDLRRESPKEQSRSPDKPAPGFCTPPFCSPSSSSAAPFAHDIAIWWTVNLISLCHSHSAERADERRSDRCRLLTQRPHGAAKGMIWGG